MKQQHPNVIFDRWMLVLLLAVFAVVVLHLFW
jgi:hypothetical protein